MLEEFYELYDFVLLNTYTNVTWNIFVQLTLNLQALEMKDDDLFIYSIEWV